MNIDDVVALYDLPLEEDNLVTEIGITMCGAGLDKIMDAAREAGMATQQLNKCMFIALEATYMRLRELRDRDNVPPESKFEVKLKGEP